MSTEWETGARAAVLGRLWGALRRERIPGIEPASLSGDVRAAAMFATPPPGLRITFQGRGYDDPGALVRALAGAGADRDGAGRSGLDPAAAQRFAAELDDSVANLALARAAQPAPDGGPPVLTRPVPHPAYWEQLVVDGHPLHPGCRTRLGMSTDDVRRYAPEHRQIVDLVVVAVPPDRWLTTGSGLPPLLHLHPWQADRLLPAHPELRPTGTRAARPLMSLRTLVPLDDPTVHLKTAIDAQLTSAVRTVSPAAVHNGPELTGFLAGLVPGVTILREYAGGAVLTGGEPDRRLAVVHRQAPPLDALPLATLSAPSPADGAPLAVEAARLAYGGDPRAFLTDLARVLLPAPLALLDLGVGLEAHGQNTLVSLDRGRPTRLYYRDVGGVRVDPDRLRAHGIAPPSLRGDIATPDPTEPATTVLAALGVVLGEVVATLARATGTEAGELWKAVGQAVPAGSPLWRETLPVKATTAMRLADDPLTPRWATIPNPLAEAR